jgi:capsular polysaccharide biosynthesis protein
VIIARARSADAASRIANDVATQVIAQNQAYVTRLLTSQRQLLQQHLTQISADMAATQKAIDANTVQNRDNSGLVAQLTVEGNQYQNVYSRIQDLDVQQAQLISGLTIQQPATRPSRPVDPDPRLYLPIGLVGGLTIGFLLALLAERFRTRVVDAGELAEIAGTDLALTLNPRKAPLLMGSYGLLSQRAPAGDGDTSQVLLVAASPEVPVDDIAWEVASAVAAEGRKAIVAPAGVQPVPVEPRGLLTSWPAPPPRTLDTAGADLVIRCVSPLARPALWLDSSVGPAVLVAVQRRTRLRDVRRMTELLRHRGIQTMAVILLKSHRVPARRHARETGKVVATEVIPARHADEQTSSSQAPM